MIGSFFIYSISTLSLNALFISSLLIKILVVRSNLTPNYLNCLENILHFSLFKLSFHYSYIFTSFFNITFGEYCIIFIQKNFSYQNFNSIFILIAVDHSIYQ